MRRRQLAWLRRQRGGGSLLMVVMLLLMGSLLLNATRRQLSDGLGLVAGEGRYYRQSAAAASALAWGERLSWPEAEGWQCRQWRSWHWRACLYQHDGLILLRGDSGDDTLARWRWMERGGEGAGLLRPAAHGWLDFCPLPQQEVCRVSL